MSATQGEKKEHCLILTSCHSVLGDFTLWKDNVSHEAKQSETLPLDIRKWNRKSLTDTLRE